MVGHENNYGRIPPPKIDEAAPLESTSSALRRAMFLSYRQALCLHFTMMTIKDQACDWVTTEDDAERQGHATYPLRGPSTLAKQTAHRTAQVALLQTIMSGLGRMPHFNIINAGFPFTDYDVKEKINGEPYPVTTKLLAALSKEYAPMDVQTKITAVRQLDKHVWNMPDFRRETAPRFRIWLDKFQEAFQEIQVLDSEGTFKENEVVAKLQQKIWLNGMKADAIAFTPLEVKWAMSPPKDLNQLCQDIHALCKKMVDALDEDEAPERKVCYRVGEAPEGKV